MQVASQEDADVADVADELERPQLDYACGEPEDDGQHERREQATADRRWLRRHRRRWPDVDRGKRRAHEVASSPSRSPSPRPAGSLTNSPKISNSAASVS